jgi:hypothetical protein
VRAVLTLLRAFAGIALFRIRPQDIPRSGALLGATAVANAAVSLLISAQLEMPAINASMEMCVLIGMTVALLYAFRRGGRIVQTLTALMGASAIIGLVVALVIAAIPELPYVMRIAIFLWNMFVIAHVLRHALDTLFALGCLIAFAYALTLDGLLRLLLA